MMSIASMMSISNLSTIGFLEDDEDDDYNYMYVCLDMSYDIIMWSCDHNDYFRYCL